jgi:ABC-type antimicrobial peptide transport system permease subunit
MRLRPIEDIQSALQSLKSTKTRTLLTVTGVAIGVASITTILSLSTGVTQLISGQVSALGGDVAVVRPGTPENDMNSIFSGVASQQYVTSSLTEQDLLDINQTSPIGASAPIMIVSGNTKDKDTTVKNSTIVATTPSLADISGLTIRDGQFIDSVTNRDTAVIGSQLSVDLFGTDQSIGQTFTIHNQTFTVIGVLKMTNNPVNFNNVDFDHAAIISLESGKSFNQGVAQIQQINIRAKNTDSLSAMIADVNSALLKNHHGDQDFTILSGDQIAQPTSRFFTAVTGVMATIAAISLIVGGIGIMNIMLVGVAERTREIGLRKSVGASNGDVIWQFMVEALIISIIGGIIGYVAGYGLAFAVSTMLTFDPAFTWQIALTALGTSLSVGIVFGVYPAFRAARKDPITALRQYH